MAEDPERTHDYQPTVTEVAVEPLLDEPEQRVGSYRLLREIGRGGMGQVYLAVRADEQYQKRVAIKIIRAGSSHGDLVGYFRRERQILAGLEHPNIARLLDGGTTESGLPYFAMEYVEGEPIDRYCDRHRLDTVERLKLFRSVCSAVQYAHRNLVIHRDIKPSNVLVTAEGEPKLLDFGIAKLLDPESPAEAPATGLALTPEYASPEQARGAAISTSTDVYSLGIVLYELLTGHRAYRVKSRQPLEVLRAVCEEEPERPSTAVYRTDEVIGPDGSLLVTATPETVSRTREGSPERLRRRLRGDLDNILMMALRKEPSLRYGSVEAFSEDVRRHLEGLPVVARRPTLGYRASKFVGRNRAAVGSAGILALVIVGFGVVTAAQSVRVARERDRAAFERDKAEKVTAFLVDIFKVSNPSGGRGGSVTARELLDKGATTITTGLQTQPEVKAALMETMGNVYRNLGLYPQAAPLAEESLRLRRQVLGSDHPEVAQSLNSLANVLTLQGELGRAEALYREALEARRLQLGEDHASVAAVQYNLADVLNRKMDHAGAEALLRTALATHRRSTKKDDPAVASILNSLSGAQRERGDLEGAKASGREALALRRDLLGDDHPHTNATLVNLANILNSEGSYPEAESLHREALLRKRKALGDEHPEIAISLNNLGNVLDHEGRYPEAESLHQQALALRRKALGMEHPLVARSLGNLANVVHHQGRLNEAERLYREALSMTEKLRGGRHADVPYFMTQLAVVLHEQGKRKDAESLLRQALALQRAVVEAGHPDVAVTLTSLGRLLADTGRGEEGEPLAREAVEILTRRLPKGHPDIGEAESAFGACLAALGRFEEAEGLEVRAYAGAESKHGPQSWEARRAREALVRLYEAWDKPGQAARYRTVLGAVVSR